MCLCFNSSLKNHFPLSFFFYLFQMVIFLLSLPRAVCGAVGKLMVFFFNKQIGLKKYLMSEPENTLVFISLFFLVISCEREKLTTKRGSLTEAVLVSHVYCLSWVCTVGTESHQRVREGRLRIS